MTNVKALKLTDAENDLVDYLTRNGRFESESQFIRNAILAYARQASVPDLLMRRVKVARECSAPRRSKKLARILGPRRRGEAPQGGIT